jgi:SulP family sulfate permease
MQTYDRSQLARDLLAGIVVGIVALPLAIAFAIASGVTPDRGLWTAIVAGFLISAFGGSRVQIGGPTGAFVVIVYGIVQRYGVNGLLIATLMAGALLIVFGVFKLGGVIKFIPQPVITGFTSGIAVIIFASQIKDFLGLRMGAVPADFVEKLGAYAAYIHTVNPAAVGIASLAIAIIVLWPRVSLRLPAPFVALVLTTIVVHAFGIQVETVGSRFGNIAASIPRPSLPHVTLDELRLLVGPAFTIAMLGAIESLLSSVVADGMIGGRHRSNM